MEIADEKLQTIIAACGSSEEKFAVFDFDNSCIVNDIQEATLAYLCRNMILKNEHMVETNFVDCETYHRDVLLKYYSLLDGKKIKEAYYYAVQAMAGFLETEIPALVAEVIGFEGNDIGKQQLFGLNLPKGLRVRPQVKTLMESLFSGGFKVYVVTASSEAVVSAALRYWNFPEIVCLGVKNVKKDGKLSAKIKEPAPIVEGKVSCIKKFISPNKLPVLAVGDSMNDLPMLEYSNIKVVVDRGNALATRAKEKNWYLI